MKTTKIIALLAALVLAMPCLTAFAKGSGEDISPAIELLRKSTKIEKSSSKGASRAVDEADIAKAVGVDIGYIIIASLPDPKDGRLCLGGADVVDGQTITTASLDKLMFVPTENASTATFAIKCAADGWYDIEIPCRLTVSDYQNGVPTVTSTEATTMSGICCVADPKIFDPDGDSSELYVVRYPSNGYVKITDGRVYYTPRDGFVGTDKMTVTASDIYGNASGEATLTFKVEKNSHSIYFADMKNNAAHAAAVALAEKSVVAFTFKDGEYFFSPESSVSRVDFLVMLLTAANVPVETGVEVVLKFDDTSVLSAAKQNYLKKAVEMGVIGRDKSFCPDAGITRIAAAEWICELLELKVSRPVSFSDMNGFDEDDKFNAAAVVEAGFMDSTDGKFRPNDVMTKSEVAIALKGIMDHLGR